MNNFLKIAILLLFSAAFVFNVHAQEAKTFKGKVSNGLDNTPLENVSVRIKGTTIGTLTNAEGKYELNTKNQGAVVLVFSAKDFISEEGPSGNASEVNAVLFPDTGKGKRKRRKFLKERGE